MRITRLHNALEGAARANAARALVLASEAPSGGLATSEHPPPVPLMVVKSTPVANTPNLKKPRSNVNATDYSEANLESVSTNPSYPWHLNSCWLDTSLQLLFLATKRNFTQFSLICQPLPQNSGLKALYTTLYERKFIDSTGQTTAAALQKQRDSLRELLRDRGIISALDSLEPLCGWLAELVRLESISDSYRIASYFEVLLVEVHSCSGSTDIGGRHVEITNPPVRRRVHQLSEEHHKQYHGHFSEYFSDLTSLEKDPVPQSGCWRVHESKVLCSGRREDIRSLVVSLPVLLVVEVADEFGTSQASDHLVWDFPQTVSPVTPISNEDGCIYDLVGLAMAHPLGPHFIAKYPSDDMGCIFTYDDKQNSGIPTREHAAEIDSHLAGSKVDVPPGFRVCAAFYHLRGGIEAQDKFYESRTKYYSNKYHLKFSECNLGALPTLSYTSLDLEVFDKSQQFWTSGVKDLLVEYVSKRKHLHSEHKDPKSEVDVPNLEKSRRVRVPGSSILPDISFLDDPVFSVHCRCGLAGDGNILFRLEDSGLAIRCDACGVRSHVACQRKGRVTREAIEDATFLCDNCRPSSHIPDNCDPLKVSLESQKKQMPTSVAPEKFGAGHGALVRAGRYWYPVRLIQMVDNTSWRVRWWRNCIFNGSDVKPGTLSIVKISDIVDPLWLDDNKRREIRLGRWVLASHTAALEGTLTDPSCVAYTEDIHVALASSLQVLQQLLHQPESAINAIIPAKSWLEANKKDRTHFNIPYSGGLTLMDRSQTANWFEVHVSKDKQLRRQWLGGLPIAHAYTLVIAYRIRSFGPSKLRNLSEELILQKAWDVQKAGTMSPWHVVDVDKECVEDLEKVCKIGGGGTQT